MTHDEIIRDIMIALTDSPASIRYGVPAPYPQGYSLHIEHTKCPNVLMLTKGSAVVAQCEVDPAYPIDMEVSLENLLTYMEDHWSAQELAAAAETLEAVPERNGLTLVSYMDMRAGLPKDLLRRAFAPRLSLA